ncbi:hypothetical protein BDV3_006650 [Batrachochytrium dendrobatidis]|nr:hypothetical protein O5D80_008601 [Batrachochytrium dendrobatidis]KAK5665588.1 hypothetical protein QVD99_007238 [Batrachochytrium dendrobatidis]
MHSNKVPRLNSPIWPPSTSLDQVSHTANSSGVDQSHKNQPLSGIDDEMNGAPLTPVCRSANDSEIDLRNSASKQELNEPLLRQSQDNAQLPSTTSFEFSNTVYSIPLSTTLSKSETELDRTVSLWSGIALIVGVSIGSGIFASPGPVFEYSGSVGGALLVWIAAGCLAMAGALCYAELGTMIPSSGGEHPYLLRAHGSLPAFLFSWTGITITRPGSLSIITVISAEYACRLIYYNADPTFSSPPYLVKAIAIGIIVILTCINILSSRASTTMQNILTILKIGSLAWIGALGILQLWRDPLSSGNFQKGLFYGGSMYPGNYALALYSALWAYDGWNNLNMVAGELKNPEKNLPRAIIGGPIIVTLCYVATNLAYFSVLPGSIVASSTTVGMDFGKRVFGHVGGIIIPLIVIGSTFGAANATLYTGSRILFVSAQTGHAPKFLSNINSHTRTPINALITQSFLSIVLISIGSFKSLVNFYSMIAWVFYFLAVLGLIVMRFTEPYAERPFVVWIGVPILFCFGTVCLLVFSIWEAPIEAAAAGLFLLAGIPIYWIGSRYSVTCEDVMHICFMWAAAAVVTVLPFDNIKELLQRQEYQRQADVDDNQIEMM